MYANESAGGRFPSLKLYSCASSDCFALSPSLAINALQIYPEYLTDPAILLCPSDPDGNDVVTMFNHANGRSTVWNGTAQVPVGPNVDEEFYPCEVGSDQSSYGYFGWAIHVPGLTDDPHVFSNYSEVIPYFTGKQNVDPQLVGDFLNLLLKITTALTTPLQSGDVDGLRIKLSILDGDVPTDTGSYTFYRLAEGIERLMIKDISDPSATSRAQSEICVTADYLSSKITDTNKFNHLPGGCNVLYMDGHVEFIKYPGGWPVSPLIAVIVAEF